MQNTHTGDLVQLSPEAMKAYAELGNPESDLQSVKDAAIPNREHQGPVFAVGEILEIKGGKLRVNGISRKRLYLDSLPS